MNSKLAVGLVLFSSLAAGLFAFSVLSWADDSGGPPQWCTKAKTKVEKLICKDGQLGEFDQELGVYYENLLKMVQPSAKPDLVQSQRKWIAEREQCGATAKETEDLVSCVDTMTRQRCGLLLKDIQERNIEKRLSEFAKFKLRTFKDTAFDAPPTTPLSRVCLSTLPGTVHCSPFEQANYRMETLPMVGSSAVRMGPP